jgi:hypothetical protein
VIDDQPVSRVEWIPREKLSANFWNPNKQAPPEYRLLKISILENGWTQPIVVRENGLVMPCGTRLLGGSIDGWHQLLAIIGLQTWPLSGTPLDSSTVKARFTGTNGSPDTEIPDHGSPSVKESRIGETSYANGSLPRGVPECGGAKTPATESAFTGTSTGSATFSTFWELACPTCASSGPKQKKSLLTWQSAQGASTADAGLPLTIRCCGSDGANETPSSALNSGGQRTPSDCDGEISGSRASLQVAYEIVDGYHRWLISGDREVSALTGGLVPVVRLAECPPDVARMATIRHNRARGTHHVLKMADIVAELQEMGLSPGEIGRRLQMDDEEVSRLADRGQMTKRGAAASFGNGWTV